MQLRATRDAARGGWVLDGQKTWTTSAHFADWYWVGARTDPEAPKHRGITLFLVPMDHPASPSVPSGPSATSGPTRSSSTASSCPTTSWWASRTRAGPIFRSGSPDTAIPPARVLGIQLCDAPALPEPDPIPETLHRRLVPGEGDAHLVGLLRRLAAGDCTAPIGVEVFSDALAALPVGEVARRVAVATRGVLAAASIAPARPG